MARHKKQIKIKEPVRLREKELKDGNKSLYLDIYYKGVRKYEYLRLYVIPERTPADKAQNRKVREIAEQVKSERILALQSKGISKWDEVRKASMPLTEWLTKEEEQPAMGIDTRTVLVRRQAHQVVDEFLAGIGKPNLGLDEIDRDFCRQFIAYLNSAKNRHTKKERDLSQSTKHKYQKVLVAALNHAVREGIMPHNPFKQIPGSEKIAEEEGEREFLTIEEQKKLFDTPCPREDVKSAFIFSCLTGLRISDILALCPKHIKQSPDGKMEYIEIEQEKTGGKAIIPLLAEARKYLPEGKGVDDPYFTMPTNATICRCLEKWTEAAGISKHITFHSARHTFATTLLTLGSDLYTVSKLLGHKNIKTTEVYAKVVDSKKVESISRLDNLFQKQ